MNLYIYGYINLFTFFTCVSLAILLLAGGGIRKKANITFSIMSIITAVWQFGLYKHTLSATYSEAMFWSSFLHSFAIFIPPLYLLFVMSMLGIYRRLLAWSVFALASTLVYLNVFTRYFIFDVRPILGFSFFPAAGVLYIFYLAEYLVCFLLPIYWLLLNIGKEKGYKRQQLLLLLLSTVIGVIGSSSTFLPVYGISIFPYANCFTWLFTLVLYYAITKTRFLDISVIVSKSIAYGFTMIILGIGYLLFVIPYKLNISSSINIGFISCSITYGIFAGFAFERLRIFIQTSSDKMFLKGKIDISQSATFVAERLASVVSFEDLFDLLEKIRVDAFEAVSLKLYSAEEFSGQKSFSNKISFSNDDPLLAYLNKQKKVLNISDIPKELQVNIENERFDMIIPCYSRNKLIAIIFLGKKLSDDPYKEEEIDIFKILAPQIAVVIERTKPYEKAKEDASVAQEAAEKAQHMATLGLIALQAGHEIKNPIAAINLHSGLLKDHVGDGEYLNKYIELVNRNSKKIEDIVDKMKQFGAPEKTDKVDADINDIIENRCLFLLEGYIKKKDIRVEKEYGPVGLIKVDPSSLEQAFVNIMLNAVEAMDSGGILKIRTRRGSSSVEVILSDNGKGIAEENLDKIFLPLFTTRHEGTGLGLSISYKSIVALHGGTIDVKSGVGKGTEFTVKLPLS